MFDFQGEGQVTIEQDSPGNKEDEEEDQETHQKGYRLKPEKQLHLFPKQNGSATLLSPHVIFKIYYYL